jgi:hypothetical protein
MPVATGTCAVFSTDNLRGLRLSVTLPQNAPDEISSTVVLKMQGAPEIKK